MVTINPYINFNGNAEEAFNFYKSVFGGEFTKIIRLKDIQVLSSQSERQMRIRYCALV
jgi:PhnB protein